MISEAEAPVMMAVSSKVARTIQVLQHMGLLKPEADEAIERCVEAFMFEHTRYQGFEFVERFNRACDEVLK